MGGEMGGVRRVDTGAGSTTGSKSPRARERVHPVASRLLVLLVVGSLVVTGLGAVAMKVASGARHVSPPPPAMPWTPAIDSFLSTILFVIAAFAALGVIAYFLRRRERAKAAGQGYCGAVNHDSQRQAIHDRLRYCAADDAVYDPKGGDAVAAHKDQINILISRREQAAEEEGRRYGHPLEASHNLLNLTE